MEAPTPLSPLSPLPAPPPPDAPPQVASPPTPTPTSIPTPLPYQTPVTTDELISVYDQLNESTLDKVLANLQGSEADVELKLETVAEINPRLLSDESKTKSTEDLLAILEGDDEPAKSKPVLANFESNTSHILVVKRKLSSAPLDRATEKALALKQLKEMPKGKRKSSKSSTEIVDVKDVTIPTKQSTTAPKPNSTSNEPNGKVLNSKKGGDISFIHQDWSDEESTDKSTYVTNEKTKSTESIIQNGNSHSAKNAPKIAELNKRVSRVIKKKIIWDPDNPTTLKLNAKTSPNQKTNNNLAPDRRTVQIKITKHFASEEKTSNREQSDSVEKQNNSTLNSTRKKKKMSEVDRLLMDEGAVNMIYQLERSNNNVDVPEIVLKPNSKSMISKSREKKNLLNKTRIIKNAVFSVTKSDSISKRIKMIRTRRELVKKTLKRQEKVASIRNSLQSPTHGDDSTADESRIIRRHSSSSFSSGCLSPRPQSPLEYSAKNNDNDADFEQAPSMNNDDSGIQDSTVQKAKSWSANRLKRKYSNRNMQTLNNKDKLKRIQNKNKWLSEFKIDSLTEISMTIVENVASIVIKPSSNMCGLFDLKVLRELTAAVYLAIEASVKVISLTSQDGLLCSGLDLRSLLHKRPVQQRTSTNCFLETFRELVIQLSKFKGAVVAGVNGACSSFGIVLLSLSDFVLVSSQATFCISPAFRCPLPTEGLSVFNQSCSLPVKLRNEFILLGRVLSASEALNYNVVTRVCESNDFPSNFSSFVKEISDSSMQVFSFHKSASFDEGKLNVALEKECGSLADFWCSLSGQDVIQVAHSSL